ICRRRSMAATLQLSSGMRTGKQDGPAGERRGRAMTRATLALAFAIAVAALTISARAQTRVEQGQRYFMNSGCYGCHTVGKMGTPIGPDLSKVGSRYSHEYLERWLRDPSAQRPNAHMPTLELSPQQVTDLAAFLSSLR